MLAPAENVPSRRSTAIKFPPSSTTAMTPVLFRFLASATAAAIAVRAPEILSDFFSVTCAPARVTVKAISAKDAAILLRFINISPEDLWSAAPGLITGRSCEELAERRFERSFAQV